MSGSSGHPPSLEDEKRAFATYVILAGALFGAVVAMWVFARKIIVIPFAYCVLPQFHLVQLLQGGRDTSLWLQALQAAIESPAYANTVSPHFVTGACSFLALHLWWAYALFFAGVGSAFLRTANPGDRFQGAFHLTGYEYEPVWLLWGIRLPEWLNNWCNVQDKRRSLGPLHLFFLALSRERKNGSAPPLHRKKLRVRVGRSLIEYQSAYWRNMKPIAVWDPYDTIPQLSADLRPELWAYHQKIISRRAYLEIVQRTVGTPQKSPLSYDYRRAEEALCQQVTDGGRWRGVAKAPPYIQAFAVVCHLNASGAAKDAIELAYTCAEASVPLWSLRSNAGGEQIKKTRRDVNTALRTIIQGRSRNPRLPRGALLTPKIEAAINARLVGHHWIRTAMVGLLAQCGPHKNWGGGNAPILQPALFNSFIQPFDRVLFFALASVGAEKYLVEGMGVINQYQNEAGFHAYVSQQIAETEREIANRHDRLAYDRAATHGPPGRAAIDDALKEIAALERSLADWKAYGQNIPKLDMRGPLSYLEALIVHDRNVGSPAP